MWAFCCFPFSKLTFVKPTVIAVGFTETNGDYSITAAQMGDSVPDQEGSDRQPLPTAARFPDIFRPA